ncbi:hypothetical protein R6Q57_022801 [Mikania cordata]
MCLMNTNRPYIRHSLIFFDLQALQDEGLWEGVKLGINNECARSYKERKQKAKKHFPANGGYENIERAKTSPP